MAETPCSAALPHRPDYQQGSTSRVSGRSGQGQPLEGAADPSTQGDEGPGPSEGQFVFMMKSVYSTYD
jgi:hypothetical protein